jgi:hypothetical protein
MISSMDESPPPEVEVGTTVVLLTDAGAVGVGVSIPGIGVGVTEYLLADGPLWNRATSLSVAAAIYRPSADIATV